ncbi:MAG: polysaccharide pyruvyl transferase family protein [Candidatus Margulisbacteria bacterium]|nr:polysaccharide pyruvyl transferase family protein [Candidatus Margulisiibacteriota bacterium]
MKIGLVGFFGNNNVGDEAILRAMISQCKKYHVPIKIAVFTDSPEITKEKYDVIVFSRKKITHLIAGVNYCDLIVFSGGSLFQDQTSILNMFYYTGVAELCRLYKKKLVLYSQGFDRLKHFISRRLLRRAIFLAHRVSARDFRSIDYLKNDLKIKKKIGFVMDTAFLLQPYQKDNQYQGYVGINIMSGQLTNHYLNLLVDFQKKTNVDLIFVPFNPEDIPIYSLLKKKLKIDILEEGDPCHLMGNIKQMDFFIGQRYHSLIFSAAARTPFVYLGNGDKGAGFASMVKQTILPSVKDADNRLVMLYKDRVAQKNVLTCCMDDVEKDSIPELIGNVLIKFF